MQYRVSVKPGHPTGVRRRSGQIFTSTPVEIDSITDDMRADSWLQIVEIPALQLTDAERAGKDASARRDAEDMVKAERAGEKTDETEQPHQPDQSEEAGDSRASRSSRASRR